MLNTLTAIPSRRTTLALAIFAIITLAASLRLVWIDRGSLFFDEMWHMQLSTGRGSAHLRLPINELLPPQPNPVMLSDAPPWYQIWAHMDGAIHPPLYHFTLRLWRTIFGQGPLSARIWSVICSLGAIPLLYAVVRQQLDPLTALLACGIMAVSGAQIMLAQDVRDYPLLLVEGLVACWILVRLEQHGASIPMAVAMGITTLSMLLTHYFAAGAVVGFGTYAILRLRGSARWQVVSALLLGCLAFVILWGPTLKAQAHYIPETADMFLKEPSQGHLVRLFERLASQPLRMLMEPPSLNRTWMLPAAGAAIAALAVVRLRRQRELLLWICLFTGTVGVVGMLDLLRETHHLEFIRYTMVASPAICVVLASALSYLPRVARWIAATCLLPVCALGVTNAYKNEMPGLPAACAYLDSIAQPNEPLILVSPEPHGRDGQTRYLAIGLYSHLLPRPLLILTHPADSALITQLPADKDLLIMSPAVGVDAQIILPGCQVLERRSFEQAGDCLKVRLRPPGRSDSIQNAQAH